MKLFEVKTCRINAGGKVPQKEVDELKKKGVHSAANYDHLASEYYLADSIDQVWDKVRDLTCDFKDESIEIISIANVAPVLGDLTVDGKRGRALLRQLHGMTAPLASYSESGLRNLVQRLLDTP